MDGFRPQSLEAAQNDPIIERARDGVLDGAQPIRRRDVLPAAAGRAEALDDRTLLKPWALVDLFEAPILTTQNALGARPRTRVAR
jgi:hypothetical protein